MTTDVLFLHGGPGLPEYLGEVFSEAMPDRLKPHFYQQHTGSGVRLADLRQQLKEQIDTLSTSQPICIVGHSWGGVLLLEYLKHQPDPRIGKIVLIAAPMTRALWFDDTKRELDRLGLINASPEEIYLTPRERELGMEHFVRILGQTDTRMPAAVEKELWQDDPKLTAVLASLNRPVLNVYGTADLRVPPAGVAALKIHNPAWIQNLPLEGAGHLFYLDPEQKQAVIDAILAFVDS